MARLTDYDPQICQQLIDFFESQEKPTIENFCKINDIPPSTFFHWVRVYPELLESKEKCFEIRRESFLNEVENMIVTDKDVKIHSFPLALIARRYGIKTKDDEAPPQKPIEVVVRHIGDVIDE